MKNVLKTSILALTALILMFSCSQENDLTPKEAENELLEIITDNLTTVANGLRAASQTFNNTDFVAELSKQNLENRYHANSGAVSSYSQAFLNVKNQKLRKTEEN